MRPIYNVILGCVVAILGYSGASWGSLRVVLGCPGLFRGLSGSSWGVGSLGTVVGPSRGHY